MTGHANPGVPPKCKLWLTGEHNARKLEARHSLATKKVSLVSREALDAGRAWRSRTRIPADLG